MAAFNPSDPRYQQAIQKKESESSMGPSRLSRVTTGEIAGQHAGYQLGRQEQFKQLALASKLADQQASQFDRSHTLARNQLGFAQSEFGEKLSREKKGLTQTMLMGGLGSLYGIYQGRKQEKMILKAAADQEYRNAKLDSYITEAFFRGAAPYGSRLTQEEQ